MYIYVYVYTYIYLKGYMNIHTYIYTYICIYICTYIRTQAHTNTLSHSLTHTHTITHKLNSDPLPNMTNPPPTKQHYRGSGSSGNSRKETSYNNVRVMVDLSLCSECCSVLQRIAACRSVLHVLHCVEK